MNSGRVFVIFLLATVSVAEVTPDCSDLIYNVLDPLVSIDDVYKKMDKIVEKRVQIAGIKKGSSFLEALDNFFRRPLREVLDAQDLPTKENINAKVKELTQSHLSSKDPTDFKTFFKNLKDLVLKPHIGVCEKNVNIKFGDIYVPIINEHLKGVKGAKATEISKNYEKEQAAFLKYTHEVVNTLNGYDCNCRNEVAGQEFKQWYYTPIMKFWETKGPLDPQMVKKALDKLIPAFKILIRINEQAAASIIDEFNSAVVVHHLGDEENERQMDRYNMGVVLLQAMLEEGKKIIPAEQMKELIAQILTFAVGSKTTMVVKFGEYIAHCKDCQIDFKADAANAKVLVFEKLMMQMDGNEDAFSDEEVEEIIANLPQAVDFEDNMIAMVDSSRKKLSFFSNFLSNDEALDAECYAAAIKVFNSLLKKNLAVSDRKEATHLFDEELQAMRDDPEVAKFYLVLRIWNFLIYYNDVEVDEEVEWDNISKESIETLGFFVDYYGVYMTFKKFIKDGKISLKAFYHHFEMTSTTTTSDLKERNFEDKSTAKNYDVNFSAEGRSLEFDPEDPERDVNESQTSPDKKQVAGPKGKNKATKESPGGKKKLQTGKTQEDPDLGKTIGQRDEIDNPEGSRDVSNPLGVHDGPNKGKDLAEKIDTHLIGKALEKLPKEEKDGEDEEGDEPTQNRINKHDTPKVPGRKQNEEEGTITKPKGKKGADQPEGGKPKGKLQKKKLTLVDCKQILSEPSEEDEWWVKNGSESTVTDLKGFEKAKEDCSKPKYVQIQERLENCKWSRVNVHMHEQPEEPVVYIIVDEDGREEYKKEGPFKEAAADCGYGETGRKYNVYSYILSNCIVNIEVTSFPGKAKPNEELEKYFLQKGEEQEKISHQKFEELRFQCQLGSFYAPVTITYKGKGKGFGTSVNFIMGALPAGTQELEFIDDSQGDKKKVTEVDFKGIFDTEGLGTKMIIAKSVLMPNCQVASSTRRVERTSSETLFNLEYFINHDGKEIAVTKKEFGFAMAFCKGEYVTKVTKFSIRPDCKFTVDVTEIIGKPLQKPQTETYYNLKDGKSEEINAEQYNKAKEDCGENAQEEKGSGVLSFWSASVLEDCKSYAYIFTDTVETQDFIAPTFYVVVKQGEWKVVTQSVFEVEARKCVGGEDTSSVSERQVVGDLPSRVVEKKIQKETIPGEFTVLPPQHKMVSDEKPDFTRDELGVMPLPTLTQAIKNKIGGSPKDLISGGTKKIRTKEGGIEGGEDEEDVEADLTGDIHKKIGGNEIIPGTDVFEPEDNGLPIEEKGTPGKIQQNKQDKPTIGKKPLRTGDEPGHEDQGNPDEDGSSDLKGLTGGKHQTNRDKLDGGIKKLLKEGQPADVQEEDIEADVPLGNKGQPGPKGKNTQEKEKPGKKKLRTGGEPLEQLDLGGDLEGDLTSRIVGGSGLPGKNLEDQETIGKKDRVGGEPVNEPDPHHGRNVPPQKIGGHEQPDKDLLDEGITGKKTVQTGGQPNDQSDPERHDHLKRPTQIIGGSDQPHKRQQDEEKVIPKKVRTGDEPNEGPEDGPGGLKAISGELLNNLRDKMGPAVKKLVTGGEIHEGEDLDRDGIRSTVIEMIRRGFKTHDPREIENSYQIVSYLKENPLVIDEEEDIETLVVVVPVARTHSDCYKHLSN